jgi:Response regulator containing CheY-like receiver domain and AraC-type DNA-binding domain
MPADRIYKIVVVEDEPVIMENIIQKINSASPYFTVTGSARNGKEALEIIASTKPDILFTDIRMPKMDGLELISIVKDQYPDIHIIILSGYNEFEYAQKAIKLGVKEYLLKPLNTESLIKTLANTKSILDAAFSNAERNILFSGINSTEDSPEPSLALQNSNYYLFLICIGHLCNHLPSGKLTSFFSSIWSGIKWSDLITWNTHWWLIDEKQPNQKFLITEAKDAIGNPLTFAERLKDSLTKLVNPLQVNICLDTNTIPYEKTGITAQKLRFQLDKCLVIGKSSVIISDAHDKFNTTPAILDLIFQNKIITLISQEKTGLLKQEIHEQLRKWDLSQFPQRWVENVLHQLIKLFHRHFSSFTEEEISQMEYELKERLSISPNLSCILEDIWMIFYGMIVSDTEEKDDTKALIDNIDDYIKANYSSCIGIEEISRKYNFNPTYLTKVFKKFKNITPAKYIIQLRINEAKHLIETRPELGIKEIGEIVGYTDQHYFSRIFKSITGKTPTEYKDSIQVTYII